MQSDYRLENVDPKESDALLKRIEEQRRVEREAWGEVDEDESKKLPTEPTKEKS